MRFEKITEVISERITGEWRQEPNSSGVNVLRTTNFTNEGKIDLSNVVVRDIEEKKIEKKALRKGDIIIEKSGGGPTQPVGRVVFFDIDSNETFLCNNFTAILRPNNTIVHSKYLLYQMLYLHKSGRTRKYQNKTTGIHNLNLEKYLQEKIALPSLPEQLHIANILSKAENLISQRKESIRLMDEYLKSMFLEMFGDPILNSKEWPLERLDKISKLERGRFSPRPRNDPSYFNGDYPFIQTGDISKSANRLNSYTQTLNEKGIKVSKKFNKGTIVIAIVGATIGATAILEIEVYATYSIIGITPKMEFTNSYFLEFNMQFWKPILLKNAPEAARANINLEILNKLQIISPPIDLQTEFAQIVEKTEALKTQYQQSLQELENLYGSLSQKAFRGELIRKDESLLIAAEPVVNYSK